MGNMSLNYGNTRGSLKNRQGFLMDLGIDHQKLVCAQQVHGSRIRYAKEEDKGKGALSFDTALPDTDALVTDKRKLPLAIFTADCLCVYLYDPVTPAIGLVHAGWRGTKENILIKTVRYMRELFKTDPSNLYVGFGPAIRGCCYEVSGDFAGSFPGELDRRDERHYLDLARCNKKQVLGLGVREDNIFDPHICTSCCNGEFFSYRKEDKSCGRTMSVIMLT